MKKFGGSVKTFNLLDTLTEEFLIQRKYIAIELLISIEFLLHVHVKKILNKKNYFLRVHVFEESHLRSCMVSKSKSFNILSCQR